MPKKTFTIALELVVMALQIDSTVSLTPPTHPFARAILLTASLWPKQRPQCCRNTLLLTARLFPPNLCSTPTKLGVCVCGTGLVLGQLTPFTKASASDKQRMTCILKHRFQNRKVQAILIPCSFCSSEFLAVSQSTTHWAHIFSSYNWNWDGKQVAG